jgi:aminoglycoside phosphotransferase (APT) family kinase protein
VDPGPHERDGLIVTFWRFVDHDPARADPLLAGRSLRELHDVFAAYSGELPTCDRLHEVRQVLTDLSPTPELAALRAFADRLPPLGGLPIHGDAHLRNILWTPEGPLWSDLENICRGPREYDVACIRFRPLPETEEAIVGYGDHDEEAVNGALVYVTLFLAAVTQLVAARGGEEARAEARRRVERALRYAREM